MPAIAPALIAPYTVRVSSGIQEAYDHMKLLQGWGLRYEQLSCGQFRGNLREAWVEGVHVYQESLAQSVFQTGQARGDSVNLGVFADLSGEAKWFGRSLTIDDVMFLDGGDELLLTTPKESTLLVLSVPSTDAADFSGARLAQKSVRDAALATRLRAHVTTALSCAVAKPLYFSKPQARAAFNADTQGLIDAYFDLCAGHETISHDRAKAVVQRAIRYVEESGGDVPPIDEISRHTFTSRRTLQNCFEKITGESPASFLKAQRLNAVRRDILNSLDAARIGDLAANRGFWHLSQFATDYKRLFGETPSTTARFARFMAARIARVDAPSRRPD